MAVSRSRVVGLKSRLNIFLKFRSLFVNLESSDERKLGVKLDDDDMYDPKDPPPPVTDPWGMEKRSDDGVGA
jgi:hypothetical protein